MKMHIGIAGPIATEYVADYLEGGISKLPKGYPGAPLTGILIGELLKQGHKVSAFTTDASIYSHSSTITANGLNFDFYVCPSRPRAWAFNNRRVGRIIDGFAYEREQLRDVMNIAKPDIIHAHWTYEFALAAISTGLPHLITCHDAPAVVLKYTKSPYRAFRYLMARQVFQKGLHFSAVSAYMALAVQHYTNKEVCIVPNPLANYVLTQGKPRHTPKIKRIGLICNGWDTRKNPQPSLEAFAKIHQNEPTSELHLFGADFGTGQYAQQWCRQHAIESGMIFHGSTPHKQLIEHLNDLDLLLHPALEESFGVVIAEAMALGLPVVAGRHSGAIPWVVGIDDSSPNLCCAVLTDVSDPEAIAMSVEKAFEQNYPERSEAGFNRARQLFSPDVVANAYTSLYKNIIHQPLP